MQHPDTAMRIKTAAADTGQAPKRQKQEIISRGNVLIPECGQKDAQKINFLFHHSGYSKTFLEKSPIFSVINSAHAKSNAAYLQNNTLQHNNITHVTVISTEFSAAAAVYSIFYSHTLQQTQGHTSSRSIILFFSGTKKEQTLMRCSAPYVLSKLLIRQCFRG